MKIIEPWQQQLCKSFDTLTVPFVIKDMSIEQWAHRYNQTDDPHNDGYTIETRTVKFLLSHLDEKDENQFLSDVLTVPEMYLAQKNFVRLINRDNPIIIVSTSADVDRMSEGRIFLILNVTYSLPNV